MNRLIYCTRIGVDCIQNSNSNILKGECEYLGFDFNICKKDEEKMIQFIRIAFKEFQVPILRIYTKDYTYMREEEISSMDEILTSIEKFSIYLDRMESKKR